MGTRHDGIEWYKRDICESCSEAFQKEIRDLFPFFTQLLQVPIGKMSGRGTRYRNGHYLESHTDATMDRVLSIVYHITPPDKWNRTCGGELEWHGSSMYQEAQPSYNTLYLFLPRAEFLPTASNLRDAERDSPTQGGCSLMKLRPTTFRFSTLTNLSSETHRETFGREKTKAILQQKSLQW